MHRDDTDDRMILDLLIIKTSKHNNAIVFHTSLFTSKETLSLSLSSLKCGSLCLHMQGTPILQQSRA